MKAWMKAVAVLCLAGMAPGASAQNTYTLPYVLAADTAGIEGFVRIRNQTARDGTVRIQAIDDTGRRTAPVTLSIDASATVNFNSRDLERGNASKGLSSGVGNGTGHWRLVLSTALTIQPLAYIRTSDGFVTAMHDVAPVSGRDHSIPFFNPGSNNSQVSRMRLINPGTTAATITIRGFDDEGDLSRNVQLTLPAGHARMITAQQLERGEGVSGSLGDGRGKWSLTVGSNVDIQVMSLLQSPTGHLSNLSTSPLLAGGGISDPTDPVDPVDPSDDHGNTPSTATVVRVPSTTTGSIETPNDLDIFRFELPNTSRLVVRTSGNTDTLGNLYRGSQRIGANDDGADSSDGYNFRITESSASPGTYYVWVLGFSERVTGAYTLHVETSGGTTPPSSVVGAFAAGWREDQRYYRLLNGVSCNDLVVYAQQGRLSVQDVNSQAVAGCNQTGASARVRCSFLGNFGGPDIQHRCGSVAIGARSRDNQCAIVHGAGASRSNAEQDAIARCRNALGGGECRVVELQRGSRGARENTTQCIGETIGRHAADALWSSHDDAVQTQRRSGKRKWTPGTHTIHPGRVQAPGR